MRAAPPLPATERAPGRPALAPLPSSAPPPGPNFADLLQRGQATHGVLARPVAPPPLRAGPQAGNGIDRDSDDEAPTETQRAARVAAAKAGAKPAQPREKAAPAAPPMPNAPAAAAADAARGEDRAVQRAADDAAIGTAQGVGVCDWLASLKLQELANAGLASPATADSADGAEGLGRGMTSALAAEHDADAGDDSPAAGDAGIRVSGGARFAAQAAALAAGAPAEPPAASSETVAARDATPPLPSGAAGAVARGFDPGTLAPIALPTPLHAPDFAALLGAQVSLLARDGVQQAELHLNPAEMGPISVQIEIDGQQARVDFSADTAATREVIERGLPELAAALREQGLTLSGGGVFQRAPEQREPSPAMANAGRSKRFTASVAAGAVTTRPVVLPAARGLLDLYA